MTLLQLAPLLPLKRIAAIRSSNVDKVVEDNEIPIRLCNYVDVYYNDQIHPALEFAAGSAKQSEIDRFGLRPGDVLITKDSETPDDIAVPALVVQGADDLVCGYHLALLRPNPSRLNGKFLFYALNSRSLQAAFSALAQGITRFGLTLSGIGSVAIPLPDLPVQKAIAKFLDRETARIDQLIEKKQRMVEVLEEKRIAAITDLFCGVRAAGCKSFRLRYLLSQPLKYGANEAADSDDPNDVRFIRITDFRSDGTLREETFKSLPIEKAQEYLLEEGDILFARSGATVGKTFIYEESFGPCCFAGYLIRARLNRKKVVPQFVKALTETSEYWNLIGLSNIQATIQNVNAKKYAQLNVPAPPVEAQEKIVGVYKDILSRYKHLKANIDRSADRLREFRSALITASVTGEIDVSTWGKQGTSDRRLDRIKEATST